MFVAFFQLLLAMLSILVAAKMHPLLFGIPSSGERRSASAVQRSPLRAGWLAAEARLQHLCAMLWGERGSLLSHLAAAWLLLSFLWQLAILLETHFPL